MNHNSESIVLDFSSSVRSIFEFSFVTTSKKRPTVPLLMEVPRTGMSIELICRRVCHIKLPSVFQDRQPFV